MRFNLCVLFVQPDKLIGYAMYKLAYVTVKNKLNPKGDRSSGGDPQDGVSNRTLTPEEYRRVIDMLMRNGTSEATRDASMALWATLTAGRSDNLRLTFLSDFCPPFLFTDIGEPLFFTIQRLVRLAMFVLVN